MGTFKDQAKGAGREMKGKVKEEAGDLTDKPRLEGEGKQEKLAGRMQKDTARTAGQMEGSARELKGSVKSTMGRLSKDRSLEGKAEAERTAGKTQRKPNE